MNIKAAAPLVFAIVLWAALTALGLWARPLLPVDETRYLAVAWEMFRGGDYLVPHLNGIEYHHKPPLLFWIITLGWQAIGVSELWGRLVAPLFALGSLLLTWALGRLIFPRAPEVGGLGALLLVGAAFFTVFASLTFFDSLVTFFTMLGLIGVWIAGTGRTRRGWLLFALALGLGVLSKGPVQLLNIVTVALLAPLWLPEKHGPWSRWYGGLVFAIVIGAALALLWAIPAAIAGGTQFAYMLFIGQTTERVVEALWHERPWWWYVPISFALLFPWLCWTEVWRGAFVRSLAREPGVRFCLSMIVPVFAAFSAISGKQPHYLLPTMAVFALLAARLLIALRESERFRDSRWRRVLPVLPVAAIGVAMIVLGIAPGLIAARVPAVQDVLPLPGLAGCGAVLIVIAVAILADGERGPVARAATFALAIVAVVTAAELSAAPYLHARYATGETAAVLAQLQANGTPIAHIDDYHGQYHFAGRLTKPIDPVTRDGVIAWADAHPDGAVIDYRAQLPGADMPPALYTHPYRGRFVVVWPAAAIAERGRALLD